MIKNVVFDIGRVLLEYEPLKYLNNLYDPEKSKILYENIFLSKEWVDLDLGIITKDKAKDLITSRIADMEKEVSHVLDNWYKSMIPIKSSVSIKKHIRKNGLNIYLLSNMNEVVFENLREENSFLSEVEGQIVSGYENILKPNKEIYKTLIGRYKINPKESLFIDDTKENVDAAIDLGFKSVVYKGPSKLKEDIKNYLNLDV